MQTNDTEQRQIAPLEMFAATGLADLERLLAGEKRAQIAALEQFATDSGLTRLLELAEEQRAEFDALDFLGISELEEFHSNFLAWLLNPRENHGLGDYFLRHFLLQTRAHAEVGTYDWLGTSVHREWRNEVDGQPGYLDILIVNESTGFLCAIENKIWSDEHSEQLTRYRKALKERYPDYDRHYIFLSPKGTLLNREEEQEHWTTANYYRFNVIILDRHI